MKIYSFLKDRTLNRNIVLVISIITLLLIGSIFYVNNNLKYYQSKEILRYANIIGAVEENSDEEITGYIIDNKLNEEYVKIGLKYLSAYGYSEHMEIENKWIGTSFKGIRDSIIIWCIMFIIITIILVGLIIYKLLCKINKVSEGLEELSYGKRFIKLEENEEGIIDVLYHRYNTTASRMQSWIYKLEKEKNLIKELLNDLSHQLKTPIASIKMNTDLILDGYTNEEESKQFLENNKENVDRMMWITEGLLQLSRLEINCININKKSNNLKKTLLSAINSTYGKALSKGISINVDRVHNSKILHDERWTTEGIINIIDNAIKYSNANSHINISLISTGWKSEIIIKDFGYGIKKKI